MSPLARTRLHAGDHGLSHAIESVGIGENCRVEAMRCRAQSSMSCLLAFLYLGVHVVIVRLIVCVCAYACACTLVCSRWLNLACWLWLDFVVWCGPPGFVLGARPVVVRC